MKGNHRDGEFGTSRSPGSCRCGARSPA